VSACPARPYPAILLRLSHAQAILSGPVTTLLCPGQTLCLLCLLCLLNFFNKDPGPLTSKRF
jgi:hypothetical protein